MRKWPALIALLVFAVSCSSGPADHRVLFIGNSLTHGNDLPAMVEAIAQANGSSIEWEMIAPGGATLADHNTDNATLGELLTGGYDVVVVQEQSQIPAVAQWTASLMWPNAIGLAGAAHQGGARVVWFQTWGRREGAPELGYLDFDSMQEAITATYLDIGWETGGVVAPAGQRWQRVIRQGVPISLHAVDGVHASPAGSYAAAIEIAAAILEHPILEAPDVAGVDEETARLLLNS